MSCLRREYRFIPGFQFRAIRTGASAATANDKNQLATAQKPRAIVTLLHPDAPITNRPPRAECSSFKLYVARRAKEKARTVACPGLLREELKFDLE